MTTFYIIRHAHKERGDFYNLGLQHQEKPVSQRGQAEARKIWSYLREKQISAIYVSAFQRTGQTIDDVAVHLGVTPVIEERLHEIDNGCVEGMSDEEIQRSYPEVWRGFHERSADFRFPEGETGEEASGSPGSSKIDDSSIQMRMSSWSAMKD